MRGSAVPTIVWSRAARNSASMMPTVTRTRRRPWISPDMACLLLRGWRGEDVAQICDRGAHPCALLRRQAVEEPDHVGGGRRDDPIDLGLAGRADRDEDRAAVSGVGIPPGVAVGDQTLDQLGHGRGGGTAEGRDLAGAGRPVAAEHPEDLHPHDRAAVGVADGVRPELAEAGEQAEQLFGKVDVGFVRDLGHTFRLPNNSVPELYGLRTDCLAGQTASFATVGAG